MAGINPATFGSAADHQNHCSTAADSWLPNSMGNLTFALLLHPKRKSSATGTVDEGIPPELQEVFDIIEKITGQMVTWLKNLVAIPSVSAEKEHHKDIVRAIKETSTILQEQGAHVTEVSLGDQQLSDGSKVLLPPLLLATTGQEAAKKTLCVYGHLDVYPARKFLIDSMAEVGSQGLDSYLAENAKEDFFRGINFVCIADGFWLSPCTPSISYGLRGWCSFNVEITSAQSHLESGADGGALHEPMADVVFLLDSLMGARGHVSVEGFHDDVAPITDTEWKLYEHVDFDTIEYQSMHHIRRITIDDRLQLLMRKWRYPSLTIHGIEGAHSSHGEKTVIPGRVVGKFSACTVPNQTCQKVCDCVTSHLERQFTKRNSPNGFKVTMTQSTETWSSPPKRPHTKATVAAVRHTYGVTPDLTREGASVVAASHLYKHVCSDMIVLSMTPGGRGLHSTDEYLKVDELVAGAKLFAAYMFELSKLP
ncbi:cytosolic non-specific dipeptidase isoform X2 [Rhipicephalus microplus]|uniref:cytosolic non-specific dipeptidase isoform X2 n=1 Tax=Rhipicephalus microplus TaxID=6941 RepID=UPI003F6B9EBB